ncbi:NAD-dependent epimerase/dehydratase family protein [Microcystis aeruginosa LEGE 11464]|jgi:nucleoside-diphosphate-sugar epimerase|uniref:NAD-dependent epimerase/dehydratase family protein n=1 Tax=Microcystis TaxID=1125 RepID=UPI00187ECAD2|nr:MULTISPECIES: NAD-dependent epimerase/dehydratase family protein [Microcystis]MBE9090494.1 NAD-dependent epimerase/dehydratase family protein [Microcystis aeruginosa LEGE 11464]MCA2657005.1 NAD-dependent epimerase/dehydratase family protein [Microcystis sp. M049S2]MCZ8125402.1 NAD-dependent epimerase/dehydratase family protein [Microcystis sp. LE19-114.1B]
MKNILVTGATGFIGSYLLPILSQQKFQITAAVRNNLSQSLSIPIKTIKVGHIDEKTNWQKALEGIDIVIHLAARAHIINETIPNPEAEFIKVNTQGTANLVEQSIQAGVKHFIFISSIGAMTTQSDRILTENSPCHPDSPYGRSKLQAEQALINLAKDSNMTWTIIRPTLVYGPGNPGNMERLMKLIKRGLPLPFGAIKNRRSFVFVGNLVAAIITCLDHPNAANQIFLISDNQAVSTPQLIRLIAQRIQQPCQLLPVPTTLLRFLGYLGDRVESITGKNLPFNTYNIDRLLGSLTVDSSHIQKTLDWQPTFTLEQGLAQTIQPEN